MQSRGVGEIQGHADDNVRLERIKTISKVAIGLVALNSKTF